MSYSIFEKIFINQYRAIKPPWISKELFYRLVFNFCDRWCERGKLSGICRIYQEEKERERKFIKQGIDPKVGRRLLLLLNKAFKKH